MNEFLSQFAQGIIDIIKEKRPNWHILENCTYLSSSTENFKFQIRIFKRDWAREEVCLHKVIDISLFDDHCVISYINREGSLDMANLSYADPDFGVEWIMDFCSCKKQEWYKKRCGCYV